MECESLLFVMISLGSFVFRTTCSSLISSCVLTSLLIRDNPIFSRH
jgi:hypothetical protein